MRNTRTLPISSCTGEMIASKDDDNDRDDGGRHHFHHDHDHDFGYDDNDNHRERKTIVVAIPFHFVSLPIFTYFIRVSNGLASVLPLLLLL